MVTDLSAQNGHYRKDISGSRVIGTVLSVIFSLAGIFWQPDRYTAVPSNSVDPAEAAIENRENRLLETALNEGKVLYHERMGKIVRPRPALFLFFVDMIRLLLFPTLPIIIVGTLVRKTW